MSSKVYHFLSGLPRSGSTLLASILNQNSDVYVTPTSPMLNVAVKMQEAWREDPTVKANYYEEQARNITRAILPAFWQHRPEGIIIDKGRGWAKNMPTANALFGKEIKVIVCERDLPSIMASWLELIRKQPGCSVDMNIRSKGFAATDENRMAEMWYTMVKDCMEGWQQIRREVPHQIIRVHYDDLVGDTAGTLVKIADFLELPAWNYDLNNIENDTVDDDLVAWGFSGLHTIRKQVGKTCRPAAEVLGGNLYKRFLDLEKQYV